VSLGRAAESAAASGRRDVWLASLRSGASVGDADPVSVRCLLVDDNEAFLSSASRLLESQGVAVVGRARTSSEALRLARHLRPDVVLVDVLLGEERGLDLAKRLSEIPRAAPVILVSTHTADELEELLADSPAVGFLPKKALSASAITRVLG
jgi:CheY-like chemotaxis protein